MLLILSFTGVHCETNIDECVSFPCLHDGVCSDGVARFDCECPDAWTGSRCELEVNECESDPCLNNGLCTDDVGSYTCRCLGGFIGA